MSENEQDGIVLSVQESRSIPEGTHTGRIRELSTRPDTPVGPYLDIEIDILDMSEDTPKVLGSDSPGFPAKLTSNSWLAQLVEKFGVNIGEPGQEIDLEEILVGEAIQFETEDEKTEHGTFANIMKQTIRPHPDYEESDVWDDGVEDEDEGGEDEDVKTFEEYEE